MTPPPTTTQKVKREGFKAETKCKISRVRVPSEIATPTRVRCGENPGILQGGSRGRSLECRPSTSHVDSLPLPPGPGFGRQLVHAGWHPTSRPPSTVHPSWSRRWPECISNLGPERDGEQEVPILQRRNSPSPNPPTPQGNNARGSRPQKPRERAGVATPHPGPAPEVHAGRARRLLGTTSRGPTIPLGPGLHAARVPLRWERERRRGAGSPGSKSNSRVAGFRRARPAVLCPLRLRLRDAPSGRSLPQEKLLTPHGAVPASVPHPQEPTLRLSRAPGTPPRRAPILHGTKMSRRVTGQPPPRPTPSAGRTRCLRAARPGDSPSARPPRRGGEGRAGPGQTQYGRAPQLLPWLPAAASGTPSREQAAAAAVAAAAAPHPPPARWLPPLLPAPLPWQRGAKALGPAPLSVPPPAAGPGLPPASYQGGGRPSGLP